MKRRDLIVLNSAGLHAGGAVQVATSFIDEVSKLDINDLSVTVLVSTEIHNNLLELGTDTSIFDSYQVVDVFGVMAFFARLDRYFKGADVVFTVFGPAYYPIRARVRIAGFAQPWIIYPENDVLPLLTFSNRIKHKLKFAFQAFCFRWVDRYIVELPHVKERLLEIGLALDSQVDIVHNTLPEIYSLPSQWRALRKPVLAKSGVPRIGFLGRDYSHKNLGILATVYDILLQRYDFEVAFVVTLNEKEMAARDGHFRDSVVNVGPLTMAECPTFYQAMDGVVFPSLLECFSITPLEAMAMGKPLFASDRKFVRDVCQDFPVYFDPLDAVSIASAIATYFRSAAVSVSRLSEAQNFAFAFSSAKARAERYMEIVRECI